MEETKKHSGIFHLLVEKIAKSDATREKYIWDFCYRYEVYVAVIFAIICGLITDKKINDDFGLFFMASIIGSGIIVFPLYKTSKYDNGFFEKREDIGQFRFMLSTVLGWSAIAMLLKSSGFTGNFAGKRLRLARRMNCLSRVEAVRPVKREG